MYILLVAGIIYNSHVLCFKGFNFSFITNEGNRKRKLNLAQYKLKAHLKDFTLRLCGQNTQNISWLSATIPFVGFPNAIIEMRTHTKFSEHSS